MLRELGPQRPSVFELLVAVHALRGSKSRFNYTVPVSQPLSPTKQRASMLGPSSVTSPSNSLEGLVSYRQPGTSDNNSLTPPQTVESSLGGGGIQARDKVLEAIAPMRRGRPGTTGVVTAFGTGVADRASSPVKKSAGLGVDEPSTWKQVKGHKSGVISSGAWKQRGPTGGNDDAWKLKGPAPDAGSPIYSGSQNGFGDTFGDVLGSMGGSFGTHTDENAAGSSPIPIPPRPTISSDPPAAIRGSRLGTSMPKDAFHGLGLAEKAPAPTLGEASKARVGLTATGALSSSETARVMSRSPGPTSRTSSLAPQPSSNVPSMRSSPGPFAVKPPASPQPAPNLPPRPTSSLRPSAEDLTPEQRFPSLEELDRTFASPSPGPQSSAAAQYAGVRSQPVTGGAMLRDAQAASSERRFGGTPSGVSSSISEAGSTVPPGPMLTRKHRSSVVAKTLQSNDELLLSDPALTPPSQTLVHSEPKDWLTGDEEGQEVTLPSRTTGVSKPPGTPVLRESPSKRASFIQKSDFSLQAPQEAIAASPPRPPSSPSPQVTRQSSRPITSVQTAGLPNSTGLTDNWSPVRAVRRGGGEEKRSSTSSGSSPDGPEDLKGYQPANETGKDESKQRPKSRQNTYHDLVGLYGRGEAKDDAVKVAKVTTPDPRRSTAQTKSATSAFSVDKKPSTAPKPTVSHAKPSPALPTRPGSRTGLGKQLPLSPPSNTPSSPAKSRPQSMFIFPVSKTTSTGNISPVALPGLTPPTMPAARSTHRRSSISDMVQLYESYTGNGKPTNPPATAAKPAALKMGSRMSNASATSVSSPSAAAARFPQLSPTSTLSTLAGTAETSSASGGDYMTDDSSQLTSSTATTLHTGLDSGRRSPAKKTAAHGSTPSTKPYKMPLKPPSMSSSISTPTPSRSPVRERRLSTNHEGTPATRERRISVVRENPSPVISRERKMSTPRETPGIRERKASLASSRPTLAIDRKATSASKESPVVGSPSPERPYEGVGKLIDRWQKNIADAEASSSHAGQRGNVGLKRTGIATGKGT
jgi:AP2-associated kinase